MFITRTVIAALFCLGAVSLTQAAVKLSDFVTPCSLKDPKLDDCMMTQGNALIPRLAAGVRGWDILPMDPLLVPVLQLQQGNGGSVGLELNITDALLYGSKDAVITRFKLDKETFDMEVDLLYPVFTVAGTYFTKGRILLLPITGSGSANITFLNIKAATTFKSKIEERGDQKYLKVVDFKTVNTVGNIKIQIDNLFNNKELSDQMNVFLNENALEAFEEIRAGMQDVMADIMSSIISRMFKKVPLKQLFTDL